MAAHGTVGLQHASMALYNAWCDRVPVYMVIGNYNDAAVRAPAEWYHGVQDAALMVRDFTKWDDTPWSLTHFAESAVRAYNCGGHAADGAGRARPRRHPAGAGRRHRQVARRFRRRRSQRRRRAIPASVEAGGADARRRREPGASSSIGSRARRTG